MSGRWFAPLLIVAAFGPYVIGKSVRPEPLMIYLSLPVAIGYMALGRRSLLRIPQIAFPAAILGTLVIWATAVTLFLDRSHAFSRTAVARSESFIQPLAVIIVISAFVHVRERQSLDEILRRCCMALVAALAINAALTVVHAVFGISWFFEPFLPARSLTRGNVWDRALSLGRYTGVFATPFDSGLTYSLGLLVWVYLSRSGVKFRGWMRSLLPLLLVGAVASVSKVSLFIGLPLFLAFLASGRGLFRRFFRPRTVAVLTIAAIAVAAVFFRGDRWRGALGLLRFVRVSSFDRLVGIFTGGRYAGITEGQGIAAGFLQVWRESPVFGFGFARQMVVDSAYLDIYVVGGLLALLLYLALQVGIGLFGLVHCRESSEGKLAFFMFLLIAAAAAGSPVVTANRFAPAFWTLYALLVAHFHLKAAARRSGSLFTSRG